MHGGGVRFGKAVALDSAGKQAAGITILSEGRFGQRFGQRFEWCEQAAGAKSSERDSSGCRKMLAGRSG